MVNEILMKLICKKCKKEVEINKHRMRQSKVEQGDLQSCQKIFNLQ